MAVFMMFMRLAFKPWICNVDPYILPLCAKRYGLSLTFIYNFVLYSNVTTWLAVHIMHHLCLLVDLLFGHFYSFYVLCCVSSRVGLSVILTSVSHVD